jgi:leucyl/phenylalanyl-tRNA--protein transferase
MALTRRVIFPPVSRATPEGVVAAGGHPDAETLKAAYSQGIFPWPHEGVPLLWFSPDPRFVLTPDHIHVSRSLRREMRRGTFGVRADTAFREVIRGCSAQPRPDQRGTWITDEMVAGYTALHEEGLAHSIEAWRDGRLVGGLYGVALGGVFFGESMFALEPNASKVAFATLLANLVHWGFAMVDCQAYTDHLASFGAVEIRRSRFLAALKRGLRAPSRPGPWTLEVAPAEAATALGEGG